MLFLTLIDPSPSKAVPEVAEVVLPENTPGFTDRWAAKVLLDVYIQKIKYGKDTRDALSVIPNECLNCITPRDLWQVLTYWRPVNYHRIKYKIANRVYKSPCQLDVKYWKCWEPILLETENWH
jgi:hypothetical protein